MPVVRRRTLLVDLGIGVVLGWFGWVAAMFTWDRPRFDDRPPGRDRDFDDFHPLVSVSPYVAVFLVLVVAGVAVRRIWPRAGFVAVVAGLGGYLALGAGVGPVFAALAFTVFAMAGTIPLRRWVPLTGLLVPMVLAGHWQDPYLGFLDPVLYATLLMAVSVAILPAMFALLRRARRDNELRERDQDRRRYADEERLRIAREVHDVVGHSLAVITMQAGVALHLGSTRPDQVTQSLEAIRKTSKEALAELRTTLEVFRESDDGTPRSPRPGLARLDDLVAALVAAGREVRVVREGSDERELPSAVDQAAFRIIQEALTNVVRHAGPAAGTTVTVVQEPRWLRLSVADDGSTVALPEAGNGIRGMRERARAIGGTVGLELGVPTGLIVRADLPVDRDGEGSV
ncbi:MAG TPA: sensor histidine kinase [Propionibacteriaceae bacterium]